jgi:hypothetical protein
LQKADVVKTYPVALSQKSAILLSCFCVDVIVGKTVSSTSTGRWWSRSAQPSAHVSVSLPIWANWLAASKKVALVQDFAIMTVVLRVSVRLVKMNPEEEAREVIDGLLEAESAGLAEVGVVA